MAEIKKVGVLGCCLMGSGIAQVAELVWQLRGQAGERQVPGARIGLAHNIGLGGAVVVTAYQPVANGS